jgi:large subunit ribosomal protein L6
MVKMMKFEESIEAEKGVEFSVKDKVVTVKGPKGTVSQDFSHAKRLHIEYDKATKKINIFIDFPTNKEAALARTIINLIKNMQLGVLHQYTYKMKLIHAHFPITVEPPKKGSTEILIKSFIGERSPRKTYAVGDVKITANKEEVIIVGCSSMDVGQTAANIQKCARVTDKDKRIFQDGVFVYEKLLGDKTIWKIK